MHASVVLTVASSMYPQVSGPPLPSVVLDLLPVLASLSPALMTTELSCLEDMKLNIKRKFQKSTSSISRQWYNNDVHTICYKYYYSGTWCKHLFPDF